mmetsp:Transcript_32711/g.69085  ORF Transcript_32711/g.69085 Transcript_32711/m.69085 type:complete len:232 (-) Transcript_32711:221-916(-)|eukprot:CAMPEP_0183732810 /NCGR_PEP_ID=MMETSP0737-20130205/39425_1 /TAXON_ID=385413 /ORGANISM="Thalassiosira miniscula, Strain CCMP1093" /LENGTH=231 /DNA_ID=CAMNT_0025965919 /DNA_START=27 /DNA_END=722 /DNA_ORIENTATION=+
MTETNKGTNAKRRLDLGSTTKRTTRSTKVVENPYLKKPPTQSASNDPIAAASTITPETGIEKFFVSKKAGEKKPSAARQLVTPRDEIDQKRKSLDFNSEDDDPDGSYYHSDNSRTNTNNKRIKTKKGGGHEEYEPASHIHSTLDYHHRGELPLDEGTLKAYRFIRNHFFVPYDIEADPKFGAYSGSCFEKRVIRAYTLGQLEPKKEEYGSLLVCSYCGEEGHKRDGCSKLL